MQADLRSTLASVAAALGAARDPWWIIGSAAMALQGATLESVADVDVLLSPRDARDLLAKWRIDDAPGVGSDRFRSEVFARFDGAPLPVEVMAGFRVRTAGGWVDVLPSTRQARDRGGHCLYVPSVDELLSYCELFGRDKDRSRAAILRRLGAY